MNTEEKKAYNIFEIASNFCIEGNIEAIVPHGSGFINDTFHVKNTTCVTRLPFAARKS
jgi:hypothetical protein